MGLKSIFCCVVDWCVNTLVTPILGGALTGQKCPSTSACPLASAGSTCYNGGISASLPLHILRLLILLCNFSLICEEEEDFEVKGNVLD